MGRIVLNIPDNILIFTYEVDSNNNIINENIELVESEYIKGLLESSTVKSDEVNDQPLISLRLNQGFYASSLLLTKMIADNCIQPGAIIIGTDTITSVINLNNIEDYKNGLQTLQDMLSSSCKQDDYVLKIDLISGDIDRSGEATHNLPILKNNDELPDNTALNYSDADLFAGDNDDIISTNNPINQDKKELNDISDDNPVINHNEELTPTTDSLPIFENNEEFLDNIPVIQEKNRFVTTAYNMLRQNFVPLAIGVGACAVGVKFYNKY